ncbi:MAG: glycerophosphodiester phosphodiesterase family protein [Bacillota bacterium]
MAFALWVLFACAALLFLFALYLWLIAPARKPCPREFRRDVLYAHRGLHDGNHSVIENSMRAFALAVEHGYGMEMDLQTTRDGRVVIHHDLNTLRVCGADAVIEQTDYADLPPLPDGTPLPLFSEFLKRVDGKTPLIIELKYHKQYLRTVRATLTLLEGYSGDYCLESFHPAIVQTLRKHAPDALRGQLSSGNLDKDTNPVAAFMLKHLLINVFSRPHFIAYDFYHDRTPSLKLCRLLFKPVLIAWTVKSQAALDEALTRYDTVIFEGFIPIITS